MIAWEAPDPDGRRGMHGPAGHTQPVASSRVQPSGISTPHHGLLAAPRYSAYPTAIRVLLEGVSVRVPTGSYA